jgi:hypothetical protein
MKHRYTRTHCLHCKAPLSLWRRILRAVFCCGRCERADYAAYQAQGLSRAAWHLARVEKATALTGRPSLEERMITQAQWDDFFRGLRVSDAEIQDGRFSV